MTSIPPPADAFDSHADDYERQCMAGLAASGESREFFARGRIRHLRHWWERQHRSEPGTILDYGCGLGDSARLLAESFPTSRVLGVDPAARLVERARNRHGGERVCFALLDESLPGQPAMDLIHLNGVLHHIEPEGRPAVFAALKQALAPDGVLALFENNPLNPGTRWVMSHIPFDRNAHPLRAGTARRLLRDAGFAPVHRSFLFWFPRALRMLRPVEPLLTRLPLGAQYGLFATHGS